MFTFPETQHPLPQTEIHPYQTHEEKPPSRVQTNHILKRNLQ